MPRLMFPLAVLAMLSFQVASVDAGAVHPAQPSLSAAHVVGLAPAGAPAHRDMQLAGCPHGRSYGYGYYGPSYYPSYRTSYYGGYGGYYAPRPAYYGGYGGYGGGYPGYPGYYGGRSGVSFYIGF